MYTGSLYIASDHGGYQLKKRLLRYLKNELSVSAEDLGPMEFVPTDDYPDYAIPLAQKTVTEGGRGILICTNGIGVCIVANKVKGARAGLGYNLEAAESMRRDDNANILCLAAKLSSDDHAMAIVKKWLETDFNSDGEKERYARRLKKIEEFENKL
ncbi:MAG: RpiB/LacA/LacB family sugar-phosphate isomerase [Patescibacteria group bacterium]